jgi:hypothetical protein
MGMCQKTSDANASADVGLCAQVCAYNLQVRQASSRDGEIAAGEAVARTLVVSHLRPKRGKSIFAAQFPVYAPSRERFSYASREKIMLSEGCVTTAFPLKSPLIASSIGSGGKPLAYNPSLPFCRPESATSGYGRAH